MHTIIMYLRRWSDQYRLLHSPEGSWVNRVADHGTDTGNLKLNKALADHATNLNRSFNFKGVYIKWVCDMTSVIDCSMFSIVICEIRYGRSSSVKIVTIVSSHVSIMFHFFLEHITIHYCKIIIVWGHVWALWLKLFVLWGPEVRINIFWKLGF